MECKLFDHCSFQVRRSTSSHGGCVNVFLLHLQRQQLWWMHQHMLQQLPHHMLYHQHMLHKLLQQLLHHLEWSSNIIIVLILKYQVVIVLFMMIVDTLLVIDG
jgi:hypothetical protein